MNLEILVLLQIGPARGDPLVHYLVENFLVQKPIFGINEPPR